MISSWVSWDCQRSRQRAKRRPRERKLCLVDQTTKRYTFLEGVGSGQTVVVIARRVFWRWEYEGERKLKCLWVFISNNAYGCVWRDQQSCQVRDRVTRWKRDCYYKPSRAYFKPYYLKPSHAQVTQCVEEMSLKPKPIEKLGSLNGNSLQRRFVGDVDLPERLLSFFYSTNRFSSLISQMKNPY